MYAINPLTGRSIRVGGRVWKSVAHVAQAAAPPPPMPRMRVAGAMMYSPFAYLGEPQARAGGGRLKKVKKPLMRNKRQGTAPYESATDFAIGTVKPGSDRRTKHVVIKMGKTRRWNEI